MVRVGIVGFGYWGPNIVRNFSRSDQCRVTRICDMSEDALIRADKVYPEIEKMRDWRALATGSDVDAIAVITPVSTHFEVAKMALENGKHVFVEKPFTANSAQAEELI
jgi:predicted dehydrogenase